MEQPCEKTCVYRRKPQPSGKGRFVGTAQVRVLIYIHRPFVHVLFPKFRKHRRRRPNLLIQIKGQSTQVRYYEKSRPSLSTEKRVRDWVVGTAHWRCNRTHPIGKSSMEGILITKGSEHLQLVRLWFQMRRFR